VNLKLDLRLSGSAVPQAIGLYRNIYRKKIYKKHFGNIVIFGYQEVIVLES
jgi:hypothetical protein